MKSRAFMYYQFPADRKLRKMWLHWVDGANFAPNKYYHKVCSRHFEGGKKTCLHNIPTTVPELILPRPTKSKPTSKCRDRAITNNSVQNWKSVLALGFSVQES